ncbi:MAG: MFS transporter, partial [Pseudomonadales bacterium]
MVYVLMSVLYLTSGISVLIKKHAGDPVPGERKSPLNDIKEGLGYVFRSPIVGGLILLSIMPFLFGLSINTLLPAFNRDVLAGGPDDLGLLMTAMGVGAIAGSLVLAKLGALRHKGYWLMASTAAWGLGVTSFALTHSFYWSFVAIGVVGFVSSINMSMNRSLVQLQVAQNMRGRVMSIDLMSHGLMPIGILPIGYIAEKVSVEAGLATSGIILFLVSIILCLVLEQVRRIDTGYRTPAGKGGEAQRAML